MPEVEPPSVASYKPSAFYYRRALRESSDIEKIRSLGFSLVDELELLKAWVREQGMIPPKWNVLREEAAEKGWETDPRSSSG